MAAAVHQGAQMHLGAADSHDTLYAAYARVNCMQGFLNAGVREYS